MKCPVYSLGNMAADFQRFTQFRPCIDLHDGKVKQVCFGKQKNFRSCLEVTSDVFMLCVGRSSVALCPRTKDIFKQILLQGKEIFEEIFHLSLTNLQKSTKFGPVQLSKMYDSFFDGGVVNKSRGGGGRGTRRYCKKKKTRNEIQMKKKSYPMLCLV